MVGARRNAFGAIARLRGTAAVIGFHETQELYVALATDVSSDGLWVLGKEGASAPVNSPERLV